ncbi:MAG: GntR family transcriptional regulator [Verrucomicrobiota bacterium]|nr:GntR family transcriptional regulator [Verrucomicrobiota bacterium]
MDETLPLHERLLDECQRALTAGKWAFGDEFPSERDMAKEHGISRATANKVLARLRSEGWLEHRRGIGNFVADRPTLFASLRHFESFTHFGEQLGLSPQTKLLTFRKEAALSAVVAEGLGLTVRAGRGEVIRIDRLRLLAGYPVIHETRWLAASLYPGLRRKQLEGSFYQLCRERYGITPSAESVVIRAVTPPSLPGVSWSQPCLLVQGTAHDAKRCPLWYQRLHYAGECFELHSVSNPGDSFPETRLSFCGLPVTNSSVSKQSPT